MLKQKLTAMLTVMLNEARTKSDKTAMSESYVSGFSDGQEAMLESILEILEADEKDNKELDDFICSFANGCYVGPLND